MTRNRDEDGRLYRLDDLINPSRKRPNLTYEFLGVTRVWRWTRERMERAYKEGLWFPRARGDKPELWTPRLNRPPVPPRTRKETVVV